MKFYVEIFCKLPWENVFHINDQAVEQVIILKQDIQL